jgi:hypothetical protein
MTAPNLFLVKARQPRSLPCFRRFALFHKRGRRIAPWKKQQESCPLTWFTWVNASIGQLVEQLILNQQVVGFESDCRLPWLRGTYADHREIPKNGVCHLLATFKAKGQHFDLAGRGPVWQLPKIETGSLGQPVP